MDRSLINVIRENTQWPRRTIEKKIAAGQVTVNGRVITEFNHAVSDHDGISVDNTFIQKKPLLYYKFNKPVGTISTFDDPQKRRDLRWHITKHHLDPSLRPCGRLDRDSSGLLLFSNDGDFIHRMLHPRFSIEKVYQITLDRPLTHADQKQLSTGFFLEDGPTKLDIVSHESPITWTVRIFMGRNRILRRTLHACSYTIVALHRLSIGPITLQPLPTGQFEKIPLSIIKKLALNVRS